MPDRREMQQRELPILPQRSSPAIDRGVSDRMCRGQARGCQAPRGRRVEHRSDLLQQEQVTAAYKMRQPGLFLTILAAFFDCANFVARALRLGTAWLAGIPGQP